jgi:hypothetical protein
MALTRQTSSTRSPDSTMNDRVLQAYLEWLSKQVKHRKNQTFTELFTLMGTKEFVYIVLGDDNRMHDGRDLRSEYFREIHMKSYVDVDMLGPVSVLEVMIALSRRLEFMTSQSAEVWAWQLLQNIQLHKFSGHMTRREIEECDDRLERLIYRTYKPDGQGGFFPLAWPEADQRKIELWYQMSSYILEQEDPHEE